MSMTAGSEWVGRLGAKWADEYRRTDRSFAGLTEHLIERCREAPFHRVLDIGCGAGELSLALARSSPSAEILGLDISPDLIQAATVRGSQLPKARFALGNAGAWTPGEDFAPDLLVSRHGVMFFDDPPAAFAHLHGLADSGARLVFSCFRSRADNPWASDIAALLPPGAAAPSDPYAPGPFAFADPAHVEAILAAGGWQDIAFEAVDYAMVAGSGPDALADAMSYFLAIGPAALAARAMDDSMRQDFSERLQIMLERHLADDLVALRASAWIVSARKLP